LSALSLNLRECILEPFILRASLEAPLLKQGQMTLDALLMALLNTGDVSHLIKRTDDGLYHASSAHFGDVYVGARPQTLIGSMRAETTPVWGEILEPNTRDGGLMIDPNRSSRGGNVMNSYVAVEAQSIFWMAVGDADAVLEVAEEVYFLGKAKTSGWGRVKRWRIERYEGDGLYSKDGLPLRPIPVSLLPDSFAFDVPTLDLAWKAPYWSLANRSRCVAPATTLEFAE